MNSFRNITFFINAFLVCMLGFFASPSLARETSVHLLRTDNDRLWYINKETLVRLPDQIVSFWSRIVPRRDSEYFRQKQSALARAGKNAGRLAFFQKLDEVDCRNNRIRTLSILFYDENDRILLSRSLHPADWKAISTGSEDAVARDAVCSDTDRRTPADMLTALIPDAAGERPSAVQR